MTGELGQLALCFALALSLVMAAAGLIGARADARRGAQRRHHGSAMGLLVFVALAFGTLTYAFVVSDFSIAGCRQQLPHPEAAGLQNQRRVGKP